MNIIHQNQRFEYHENEHIAYLSYFIDQQGVYVIDHTIVPPTLSGRGIGTMLTKYALDFAREHGWQIRITCGFVAGFIEKNQAYQDLFI